jgi:hypothetical protein
MTSNICAARQIQRREANPSRYHQCPACKRTLSIAEVIERHCEGCDSTTKPIEILDRSAA